MSALDDYVGRCRALVIRRSDGLPPGDVDWVMHLIDHGEPPEAMRSLAWLIVTCGQEVDNDLIAEIRYLLGGMVPDESLPERFRAHAP